VNRAIERFWEWSNEGALPIVIDTSPCTYGLTTARPYLTSVNQARFDRLRILDSVAFVHDEVLPGLPCGGGSRQWRSIRSVRSSR